MNPAAAKEKRRSSGPSRSYLQTRIRGQRLYEAAFILVIAELTRRLHQAYEQAYDKQAAEWLLPQDTGFLIGRFGFSQDELNRLAKASERVNSENCHKFFDDTLADLRKGGQIAPQSRFTPSTLQGVLNITTLNKYSPNLTARQVGVSQSSWANVQSKFATPQDGKYASAVTLADGRVFLGSNAFYISGPVEGFFGWNSADLSGIIVHEFFHRAGLSEAQITALHPKIQQNCGIPGFAL